MLSYKKIPLEVLYDTVNNDIMEEFYSPVLSNSIEYKRASCYFSLDTLIYMSKPLSCLLKNEGVAKFIISFEVSHKDYNYLLESYKVKVNYIIEEQLNEAIHCDEGIDINLSNLGYLMKMSKLEIKIAIKKTGIFHEKFAICKDKYGNQIGFIGSLNETLYGIKKNTESITIRKSYSGSSDDLKFLDIKGSQFDKMWENKYKGHEVYDLPKALAEKIIKVSNDNYQYIHENKRFSDFVYFKKIDNDYYIEGEVLKLTRSSRFYNTKIKPRVKEIVGHKIYFKRIENYLSLKKMISKIKIHCENLNYKLIISNDIKQYLIQNDIFIEKRRELGTYIKNKDELIIDDFTNFRNFLDSKLKRKLKESQLWDAFHCTQMIKSSNYSVPGTGKTAMILGAFYYLKEHGEVDKLIVCGPLNSRKSWRDEIKLVFHDNTINFIDVKRFNKNEKSKNLFFKDEISNYDVVFMNHEAIMSLNYQLLSYNNPRYFICLDEMHKLKGHDSKRAKMARTLFADNKYKASLTGTPNPNGFQDFYSQLNILYTLEYDMFFGYSVDDLKNIGTDEDEISKFNNIYQPFFCRTTKKDLNIKEPLQDIIEYVPMNKMEEALYDDIKVRLNRNKLLMYIRMIQLTTIPHALGNSLSYEEIEYITTDNEELSGDLRSFSYDVLPTDILDKAKLIDESSKITRAMKVIDDVVIEHGRNIIVWAIFIETHKKLLRKLNELNISTKVINGTIAVDERENRIEEFKNGDFKVLIANPHTMAESVSLHLHCHDAMYVEYDFNLTHNLQSRDRIHRLGLSNDIETRYYYLVSVYGNSPIETADQYIYRRLKEKRELMLSVVESPLIETIPVDDIYELLNLIT